MVEQFKEKLVDRVHTIRTHPFVVAVRGGLIILKESISHSPNNYSVITYLPDLDDFIVTRGPREKVVSIAMSKDTITHMNLIADYTDVTGRNKICGLSQDALRVYEWLLWQQSQGRNIIAIDSNKSHQIPTEGTEILASMIPFDNREQMRQYFADIIRK